MQQQKSEEKTKIAIILFLAHEGVTQPLLWEKWKDLFESESIYKNYKIIYKVHCPYYVKYGSDFCKKYKLKKLLFLKTSWCSPSLVYEYIRCLRHITEHVPEYKNNSDVLILLTSGYDIPIAPPHRLFRNNFNKLNHLCMNEFDTNIQWIALTKKLVTKVVDYFTDEIFRQFLLFNLTNGGCSDETFLKFFFTENIQTYVALSLEQKQNCVERDFRQKRNDPSPILWKNTTEIRTMNYRILNYTVDVIDAIFIARSIKDGDHILFFRKIANTCQFDLNIFYDFIWNSSKNRNDFLRITRSFPSLPALISTTDDPKSVQVKKTRQQIKKNSKIVTYLPIKQLANLNFDYPSIMKYIHQLHTIIGKYRKGASPP
jgi:hypothetical protein